MKYLIIILLIMLAGCSTVSNYIRRERIKNFWNWFASEKLLFETVTDTSHDERLSLLLERLSSVRPGLAVEVSKEFHGTRDIIISADGDKSNFAIVQEIVEAAPHIQGWTVTAFRQRAKEDFVLEYDSLRFSPRQMTFRPIIDRDSLDLIIYATGIKGKNQEDVAKYGLITMDNLLGEYVAIIKVRHYDFEDSQDILRNERVYKLSALPEFVDSVYALNH